MTNKYINNINIKGTEYQFHANIEQEHLELLKDYVQSDTKPCIIHKGQKKIITLYGRLTPESKIVRKLLNAIIKAKHNPINKGHDTLIVKTNDNTISIKECLTKVL